MAGEPREIKMEGIKSVVERSRIAAPSDNDDDDDELR